MPAAFLIAVPLTALAVRLGRQVGAMDSPGVAGHEKVLRKVPNVGGIPIAVAVLGPLLFGLLAVEVGGIDFIARFMPSAMDYADRISSERLAWWSIVLFVALSDSYAVPYVCRSRAGGGTETHHRWC